ncbi:MAG: dolichyl-phosphate beta-glucosyltransferase [Terriglobia bacterium]
MNDPWVSVIIPAYNEADRIPRTLQKISDFLQSRALPAEVIVVDDGSTDTTPQIVSQCSAKCATLRLLKNGRNRGKGFSARHGLLEAKGKYVLLTDADLSTPLEELDKLVQALESGGAVAAIGSRALDRSLVGTHQPWYRESAGRFFNLLVRLVSGLPFHDTQCGFKLFLREGARRAFELQTVAGFGFDPEVLFLIRRLGGKIVEVPVRWNNSPASKVRFFRDSTRMFIDLIGIRSRAAWGRYNSRKSMRRSQEASFRE